MVQRKPKSLIDIADMPNFDPAVSDKSVVKNNCTIECFNVNNPDMERAISDPNSPEAKHYGDKIKSRTKAAEGQTIS